MLILNGITIKLQYDDHYVMASQNEGHAMSIKITIELKLIHQQKAKGTRSQYVAIGVSVHVFMTVWLTNCSDLLHELKL